ncbi:MAG: SCP2 sterol-binding domain-containing protein [Acidimicrobiales bacterium]
MARYLSTEWVDALDGAAAGLDVPDDVRLVVEHVVTGGPGGEVAYHVAIADGGARVAPGPAATPTVTFTEDYDTAVAIARGQQSAQAAFMAGRVKARGDLATLTGHGETLGMLDEAFKAVREDTEF